MRPTIYDDPPAELLYPDTAQARCLTVYHYGTSGPLWHNGPTPYTSTALPSIGFCGREAVPGGNVCRSCADEYAAEYPPGHLAGPHRRWLDVPSFLVPEGTRPDALTDPDDEEMPPCMPS